LPHRLSGSPPLGILTVAGTGDASMRALELELLATKAQLVAAISDLETSTEEMRSANEEYQSVNEELQSANEELQTAKEEMQSINEELQTINAELSSKNDLLTVANSDLKNLLDSTQIATIFLDNDLRIKTFTEPMMQIFHLRDSDRGRPITDIVPQVSYSDLASDVRKVQRTLALVEHEVQLTDGSASFHMRIRPYRTIDNRIDGVVITFNDISEQRRRQALQAMLAAIVASSQDAIIGHELDGTITTWNAAAERILGFTAAETVGRSYAGLFPDDRAREVLTFFNQLTQSAEPARLETCCVKKGGAIVDVALTLSPVNDEQGAIVAGSTIIRDITAHRRAEEHRDLLVHELSHRVKNTLATVQSIATHTLQNAPTPKSFHEAFMARLMALSNTHDLLMSTNWRGAMLADVIVSELLPYQNENQSRWASEGDDVWLQPNTALALGMALHELATNAAKYGALSQPTGRVEVSRQMCTTDGRRRLHLAWIETGGPTVASPSRTGFGSRLIEKGLAHELDATVQLSFDPKGLRCIIDMPLPVGEAAT
jgi:two-component system, chemotaxis family, CheB/CheR fusion protein